MSQPEPVGRLLPLRLTYTQPAEAELAEAYRWLQTFGPGVADQWLAGLTQTLENEAALQATVRVRRRQAPDAPPGRELNVLLYRRGRRGSPWHLVYEVLDEDGDGRSHTLRVVRVRHAARQGPPVGPKAASCSREARR